MPKLKYFSNNLSQGFVSIYSARMILRIASNLLGLFLPIFLYEIFHFKFSYVIYYYLAGHLLYALTVALGCKYLNKVGLRRSLRISILIGALYYFIFYLINQNTGDGELILNNRLLILLALSILALTVNRIMYWMPLHTDIAKFTNKRNRGRQLSLMEATTLFLGATMPIAAGWILTRFNYDVLFIIAIIIFSCSLLPLITLPRTREKFCWTYRQTWRELLSRQRRRAVLAFGGHGAEDAIGVIIWPIFIWELLHGNYFQVGALSSLIVIATIFFQLFIGKFTDIKNKNKMLQLGSIFYATGWIIKIFIATAFQIFVVSTYHNLTKIFTITPFDALTYEKAADQGHYVDEYTAIHEMAFQFGKSLMLVFVLFLISVFSIQWTFILAAGASLAMNFLVEEKAIIKGRHAG